VIQIALSTYHEHKRCQWELQHRSPRVRRDDESRPEIYRVWKESFKVYGARKVRRQLNREGFQVARCSIERLMRRLDLHGAVRGKTKRTTIRDDNTARPRDLVDRQFAAPAPNRLWIADIAYVATWSGFVYVALVLNAWAGSSLCNVALRARSRRIGARIIGSPCPTIEAVNRSGTFVSLRPRATSGTISGMWRRLAYGRRSDVLVFVVVFVGVIGGGWIASGLSGWVSILVVLLNSAAIASLVWLIKHSSAENRR